MRKKKKSVLTVCDLDDGVSCIESYVLLKTKNTPTGSSRVEEGCGERW